MPSLPSCTRGGDCWTFGRHRGGGSGGGDGGGDDGILPAPFLGQLTALSVYFCSITLVPRDGLGEEFSRFLRLEVGSGKLVRLANWATQNYKTLSQFMNPAPLAKVRLTIRTECLTASFLGWAQF